MKKLIVLLFLVAGCGSENTVILQRHHVSQDNINNLTPPDSVGQPAYAIWDHSTGKCDIYLLPKDQYKSEEWYLYYQGHEVEHCFSGYWHD